MSKHYLQLSNILKKLLYDRRINSTELAHAVDLPQPTVHRLVTGKSTRPYRSSLEPIADYFSISVDQLIGEKPLPVESALKITQVPFVAWSNLDTQDVDLSYPPIPFVGTISSNGFATTMPDNSMEPLIPKRSLLILDPELKPIDRSYILVQLDEDKQTILRELLIDGEHQFLKPLNSNLNSFKMKLLSQNDKFLACLLEIRHNCRPEEHEKELEQSLLEKK